MSRPGSNTGGAQDPTEEAPHTGRRGGTAENAGLKAPRRGLWEPGHNRVWGSDDLKISSVYQSHVSFEINMGTKRDG